MNYKGVSLYIFTLIFLYNSVAVPQEPDSLKLKSSDRYTNCFCFSPGGTLIAYSDGSDIRIKDLSNMSVNEKLFKGHTDRVLTIDISPDSSNIISGGRDSLIIIWDMNGNILKKLNYHNGRITTLRIDPSGNYIYSGSTDRRLICYSIREDKIVFDIKVHTDDILSIDISSDGRMLASGGADKMVYILDARTGDVIINPGKQKGWIRCVRFNKNNTTLATTGDNGTVYLWKVIYPQEIILTQKIRYTISWITAIDFFNDNISYVCSQENGVIRTSIRGVEDKYKMEWPIRMIKIKPEIGPYYSLGIATYGGGMIVTDVSSLSSGLLQK